MGALGAVLMTCSACGGTEFLRPYSPWHSVPICNPCFMVWYDAPGPDRFDATDPKAVGEVSLRLRAAGKWPWTGKYAPHGSDD
jgi:hypothetical protein